MLSELRECPQCLELSPFEAPPCVDGHGPDCPELVCSRCGAVLVELVHVSLSATVSRTTGIAA